MNASVTVTETAVQQPAAPQPLTIPEYVRGRLQGAAPATTMIFDKLEKYMKAMDPKAQITDEEAAAWQVQLYGMLLGIINRIPAQDFEGAFTVLLAVFAHNQKDIHSVMHEANVFRSAADMKLTNPEDRMTFFNLLHMLKTVADPKSRALALRQVNVNKALDTRPITEVGRQRVLAYLGQ